MPIAAIGAADFCCRRSALAYALSPRRHHLQALAGPRPLGIDKFSEAIVPEEADELTEPERRRAELYRELSQVGDFRPGR